jgi:hypothetical protein
LNPSSSQASSNSLFATSPYQNWWPASWIVTPSGLCSSSGDSHDAPPVKSVGYSIPPEAELKAGSTTVTCA